MEQPKEFKKFKSLREILEENKERNRYFYGGARGGGKTELLRAFYEGKFPQDEDSPIDAFRYCMMRAPRVKVEKKEEKPMYESPISISHLVEPMMKEYDDELGNMIVQSCMKVGVDVNKDRLLRALEYDRGQYYSGYAEGREAGRRECFKEVINMGKEFLGLTDEELCELICGKPEEDDNGKEFED